MLRSASQKQRAAFATILSLATVQVLLQNKILKKERKKRDMWSKKWLLRKDKSYYENLMRELALEDKDSYRRLLRMDCEAFEYLLERVSPRIMKKNTVMRKAISAGERLALTLRFLATGETQSSLSFQFRIAQCTISGIVFTVCRALYEELVGDFMCVPSSATEWKAIAKEFETLWNFPFCLGALDGKHVKIIPPVGSGSHFHNYKGFFSIVLLALVDAHLNFIYVDAGTNGRCSDGGVWAKSELNKALTSNTLNIPEANYLPGTNDKVPYVLVADDAFPLEQNIMVPYKGRNLSVEELIFNYRVSRARRVVENAFGILANRFRIYKSSIQSSPVRARTYVLATCVLHNFLRSRASIRSAYSEDSDSIPPGSNLHCLPRSKKRGKLVEKEIQKRFCNYFNGNGAVPWQDQYHLLH